MSYPIENLYIKEGKLFEKTSPHSEDSHPYMVLPEISIVEKRGYRPFKSKIEFSFGLDHSPCPIWKYLFDMYLDGFPAKISGKELSFACVLTDLESHYERAHDILDNVNIAYFSRREAIIEQVTERDRKRAIEAQREEDFLQTIKATFDKLELKAKIEKIEQFEAKDFRYSQDDFKNYRLAQ
jgi:hypothetical protein